MNSSQVRLRVGQVVHHRLFDYRGVIYDVDPSFQSTDNWYETLAPSRPPKDEPWYHVFIHNVVEAAYVAESDLEPDLTGEPINHRAVAKLFDELRNGFYHRRK